MTVADVKNESTYHTMAQAKKIIAETADPLKTEQDMQGFFTEYAITLETLFLERLRLLKPRAWDTLTHAILPHRCAAMEDAANESLPHATRLSRADTRHDAYEALQAELETDIPHRLAVIEAQAKLQDVASIAAKQCTLHVLRAEHGPFGASADDITYTLTHFAKQGVKPQDVQRYCDELCAKFSLTSHPTNATSVAHTTTAIALECAIADDTTSAEELQSAMDAFILAPVAAARKTPLEELEELIPVMDNLYASALKQRDAMQTALSVSGYTDKGVILRTPLMQLEDWSATFDGDGNANATRSALEQGVQRKQRWIVEKYLSDIRAVKAVLVSSHAEAWLLSLIELVEQSLEAAHYSSPKDFAEALENIQQNVAAYDGTRIPRLDDLLYLIPIFGFHGSRGNIRHDAKSLQETLALLIQRANIDITTAAIYDKDSLSETLSAWFEEADHLTLMRLREAARCTSEYRQALPPQEDDTSLRIIERLQFLGERPDIANKLIIAEATHPADAKTAMALLFATGNAVACAEAKQEIVLLVESVADVEHLCETIKTLAHDPIYQRHLQAMGKITVMIAHSDNRRRDGYSAGEVITRVEGKIFKLQQELWEWAEGTQCKPLLSISGAFGIPIHVFDGGGNDLMRGAAVSPGQTGKQHGHAAARENAPTIHAPHNTIQGEQNRLLFGDPACAAMFLEMMVSQTMYAKASVEKRLRVPEQTLEPDYQQSQQTARHHAVSFHAAARRAFHRYTDVIEGQANPFDALYSHSGAWITTLLANRGSRSNQRGAGDNDAEKTVSEIRGLRRALDQRAITGNLLFQLTGTFHLGLLGQLEAFEHIGSDAAYAMFHSSLPDRTHIVGMAQQLHMTDFGKAWRMMGKARPYAEEIVEMATAFTQGRAQGTSPTHAETLAFMEVYGLKLARAIIRAATGKSAETLLAHNRPFEMQDAYRILLPDLAAQLDVRHASHEAENAAIAYREREFSGFPAQKIPRAMEMTVVAMAGALQHDVRPAFGPLVVKGAKGVATTSPEKATEQGERQQPDIRDALQRRIHSGVKASFTNASGMERLSVPAHLQNALGEGSNV
jgi:phosphoenolpyruvate carboxylase